MEENPALSVVVPTMPSRAHYLEQCLTALSACRSHERIEVLVVTEEPARVEELVGAWGLDLDVGVVLGPLPAARKRNAGAWAARAQVLAFLDDDTRPERDWAHALLATFEDGADAVAGRVVPDFEALLPSFLDGRPDVVRGFNALGTWRREGFVIGCNIAFRRGVLERVGLFSPDFGRAGNRYHTGDETEFVRRVAREFEVRYCEAAGVLHAIQARRLEPGYLQGRAWWAGRAAAGIDLLHRPGFVRNLWSVALLLPLLVLRALRRPSAIPPRLPVIHALSYLIEGFRLETQGAGGWSDVPGLVPPEGEAGA